MLLPLTHSGVFQGDTCRPIPVCLGNISEYRLDSLFVEEARESHRPSSTVVDFGAPERLDKGFRWRINTYPLVLHVRDDASRPGQNAYFPSTCTQSFPRPLTEAPPKTLFGVDKHGLQITLIAATRSEIELFIEFSRNPDLNRFESMVDIDRNAMHAALIHVEQSFDNTPDRKALWKWVIINSVGSSVGSIELSTLPLEHPLFRSALMIGCTVLPNCQRNGYASGGITAAIDWVNKTGLVSEIQGWRHPHNSASRDMMLDLGMKKNPETVRRNFPKLNAEADMDVWSMPLR